MLVVPKKWKALANLAKANDMKHQFIRVWKSESTTFAEVTTNHSMIRVWDFEEAKDYNTHDQNDLEQVLLSKDDWKKSLVKNKFTHYSAFERENGKVFAYYEPFDSEPPIEVTDHGMCFVNTDRMMKYAARDKETTSVLTRPDVVSNIWKTLYQMNDVPVKITLKENYVILESVLALAVHSIAVKTVKK